MIYSRMEARTKKKYVSIQFHAVRKVFSSHVMLVKFLKGRNNLADCLTKLTSLINKRGLCGRFVY